MFLKNNFLDDFCGKFGFFGVKLWYFLYKKYGIGENTACDKNQVIRQKTRLLLS